MSQTFGGVIFCCQLHVWYHYQCCTFLLPAYRMINNHAEIRVNAYVRLNFGFVFKHKDRISA